MAIENVQQLLLEQLGKNPGTTIINADSGSVSGNFYCVHFPIESVIHSNTVTDMASSQSNLLNSQTYPAGTTLFLNFATFKLTSGLAILYKE
ncbi:MAG: hypothetical protein GOVbin2006_5 [Prokaryotic dsDNA virus sp.]|mgnify:CR=1 FL=1|nr:MAG: hypothetical protein GOVbin2006_5 [Prokaryotic dsDNA virus sp.]|tara:strand:- start:988 stop:1263 length:276 start_codon:yes stop_codon:yes gene_type:complete